MKVYNVQTSNSRHILIRELRNQNHMGSEAEHTNH